MNLPARKTVGIPDGPAVFIAEIGQEVPTFSVEPGGKFPALRHHVPFNCRGPYRPNELANYSPEMPYRTDDFEYVLCEERTKAGALCEKRAVNRWPACQLHGGRLHPLDKLEKELPEDQETQELSRYQQFMAGQITVDDLDDEELAVGGFRNKNGGITKPRKLPREITEAFNRAIFDRAHQELKANTVSAARTVAEIMRNPVIEPDIRLKAASIMLDRNLGKAPQVVALTGDKAFEEIFSDIFSGTRSESRRARGIIDVEVEESDERSAPIEASTAPTGIVNDSNELPELPSPEANGNNAIGDSEEQFDDRIYKRNPAVIEPVIEVKPFEYDFSDQREAIKNATKKRYASRALGVDLTSPNYPLQKEVLPNGFIRFVDPEGMAGPGPKGSAEKRRKTYTLGDFD